MSADKFQDMTQRIYFHKDSKRGNMETYKCLVEQTVELGKTPKVEHKKDLEDEFTRAPNFNKSLANILSRPRSIC
jgi:hypothetical protein